MGEYEYRPRRNARRGRRNGFSSSPPTINSAPPKIGGRVASQSRKAPRIERPYTMGARPQKRRRSSGPGILFIGLLIFVLAAVVGVFLLSRPASANILTYPADAIITFNGASATGELEALDLEPGSYTVLVERKGFQPLSTSVELKRGRRARLEYTLNPLPFPMTIATHPEGASCTITTADGETVTGDAPFSAECVAGAMTLTLTLDGYNTYTREIFLDEDLNLDLWLDPEGMVVHALNMFSTAGAPKAVAITPDKTEAWATILNGPPSIEIFDPLTGKKLDGIDLGTDGAVEVVFSDDGTKAYASQMETAKVFEIDVATRTVLREFDTESAWTKVVELSPDGKTLFAANWSGNDVSEIDLNTGELRRRIPVSKTPRGLYASESGTSLYVAGFDSGWLERVDLVSGDVTAVFKDGGALRHLVADEATGRLYVSDMSKDLIWVHDMKTGETTKLADVDEKPNTIDLSPDGKVLFVSCRGENNAKSYYIPGPEWGSIVILDAMSGEPLDAIVGGNQPTALDLSPDGTMLMFSDFLDDRLRAYEVPGYETFLAGGGGYYEAHLAAIKK
ncbi:MAG: PEGA domain-containing protein [Coriobacteriia bacterium]|nr:PEGA domain-containing protein [Coriobacteriia bacterium]